MARAARRDPTNRELDERLTRLEHQVAEIAATMTDSNRDAVLEFHAFHNAFTEHRDETRQWFTTTHALFQRLINTIEAGFKGSAEQVTVLRSEMRAGFAELRAEFKVTVGLGFVPQLQTLYLDVNGQETIQGKRKKINAVNCGVRLQLPDVAGCRHAAR